MSISTNQAETVATQPVFLQRVEFALTLTAENVVSESPGTARHAERAALASRILSDPAGAAVRYAPDIVAQLPLSTTNLVTVGGVVGADVDTTDTALATICSSLWQDFLPQP